MRPVNKGIEPLDADGNPIKFKNYSESRRYLIDKIGEYCSYCESRILTSLAVEHVQPKSINPDLTLEWSNLLLACTNCNSIKGSKNIELNNYVWPDIDNTYTLFLYNNSGLVKVEPNLEESLKGKVIATIQLTGLDRPPPKEGSSDWKKASDRRFEHRVKAWKDAHEKAEIYLKASSIQRKEALDYIKTIVVNQGFWSIWMKAFKDFPEVQKELVDSFVGTNKGYFE